MKTEIKKQKISSRNAIGFDDYLNEQFKDEEYAVQHLQYALVQYFSDGNKDVFFYTLKAIAKAQGGITRLAKKTGLSRQALYKVFSPNSHSEFETIASIIKGLGFNLKLEVSKAVRK